jgi:hypothetical protein
VTTLAEVPTDSIGNSHSVWVLACSEEELREVHGAEGRELRSRLAAEQGTDDPLLSKSAEWWAMGQRHIADYQARIDAGARTVAKAVKEAQKAAQGPSKGTQSAQGVSPLEPPKPVERHCIEPACGKLLPEKKGPGRRPERCDDCRALKIQAEDKAREARATAKAAVVKRVATCEDCDFPHPKPLSGLPWRCPEHRFAHQRASR